MHYVGMTAPGGPEVLHLMTGPTPRPAAGEVLVRVAAAGVNRPDVLQRLGKYPQPAGASPILGLEIAGTVVAVGGGVERWRPGDDLCALVAGGGYAEYCVAPQPQCLPVPSGLTMVEAAALPETFFTVWVNLFQRARLQSGETALIHGGASGIGTTAIQLAKAFGARVFVTAGSAAKCSACRGLGADVAINYREEDFVTVVEQETEGHGVDVVLDMVGGSYFERNLSVLAVEGRLSQISFLGGSRVNLDARIVMTKRLTITGSTLRPRSPAEKGAIARELEARVWPLLVSGRIRPVIYRTFALGDAAEAHRVIDSDTHIGKLVLASSYPMVASPP
jgi:putative PIG3 family NAD(P)H quinone oxidoreductase